MDSAGVHKEGRWAHFERKKAKRTCYCGRKTESKGNIRRKKGLGVPGFSHCVYWQFVLALRSLLHFICYVLTFH